ncbi:hypothetical protein C7M51_02039 [Mixta intestinalis]|jgi:hypothetical protein|uniref:Uncharacterized protein n=1 Tax=Mixta intestinalis TaxID=1615494 RepID=A0A6P1Q0U4_9GAMM|nr:hypothetical protein C7M51_02039 [Mixta intestinalis]
MQAIILLLFFTAVSLFAGVKHYKSTRIRTIHRPRRR